MRAKDIKNIVLIGLGITALIQALTHPELTVRVGAFVCVHVCIAGLEF
jgi:hypothetical protein